MTAPAGLGHQHEGRVDEGMEPFEWVGDDEIHTRLCHEVGQLDDPDGVGQERCPTGMSRANRH